MTKVPRLPKCCDSLAHRGKVFIVLRLLAIIIIAGFVVEISSDPPVSVAEDQDAESEKMILIDPDRHTDPVKVVRVIEKGEAVVFGRWQNSEIPGRRFVAGDDWVKNLAFVVKNFTSRNIVWMNLCFSFLPRDSPIDRDQFDWYLRLGQVPDVAAATIKPPLHVPQGRNIGPFLFAVGKETTISLATYADEIRADVESRKKKPFSWAAKCAITIGYVYFEDDGDYKALKWERFNGYSLPGPEGYYRLGYILDGLIPTSDSR